MVSASFALEHVVGLEDEERHAADVIAVKVREEDDVDLVAVDRELVHRNERGGAAIDQGVDAASDEMEAGIELPARAEGIAAADELQMHGLSPGSCEPCEMAWPSGAAVDASVAASVRRFRDRGHTGAASRRLRKGAPNACPLIVFLPLRDSVYNVRRGGESFGLAVCALCHDHNTKRRMLPRRPVALKGMGGCW